MREADRKKLIETLVANDIIKADVNVLTETEELSIDNISESDIGTTSDGQQYLKSVVKKYLLEQGYPFTQENVDMAAKINFPDGKLSSVSIRKSTVIESTELDDADDSDIMDIVKIQTLIQLLEIKSMLKTESEKEYTTEVITDTSTGTLDIESFNKTLAAYSSKGWVLKAVFTNEIGKNAVLGINASIDQTIMVFERNKEI